MCDCVSQKKFLAAMETSQRVVKETALADEYQMKQVGDDNCIFRGLLNSRFLFSFSFEPGKEGHAVRLLRFARCRTRGKSCVVVPEHTHTYAKKTLALFKFTLALMCAAKNRFQVCGQCN